MEIENVKIDKLKSFENNPRYISPEELDKLKKSLTKFGFAEPIVIDENNVILGGNQRFLASKELNFTDIPCVRVNGLTESEKKSLNLALNKISGDWDEIKLAEVLRGIRNEDLEFTGFNDNEIMNILSQVSEDIPELSYDGEMGEQSNMRHQLIFYFDTEEEYKLVKEYFKGEGKYPNSQKLVELVNG